MIKCNHCGLELTDLTAPCPNCGTLPTENAPPKTEKKLSKAEITIEIIKLIAKAGLIILVVWLALRKLNPDNNILGIADMRECYSYAKEVITEQLLTPSTAEFPDFEPEFVTQSSEKFEYDGYTYDVHTVTSYVDSQNIFGVMVRINYQVYIGLPMDSGNDSYYYEIVYCD